MDRLVKFMHEDEANYAFMTFWSKSKPDDSPLYTVISEPSETAHAIGAYTVVKTGAGACDGTFTWVAPITNRSCAAIRDEELKEWKFYSDLGGAAVYEDPTMSSSTVILSPIGTTGCLMVKTFAAYSLKK